MKSYFCYALNWEKKKKVSLLLSDTSGVVVWYWYFLFEGINNSNITYGPISGVLLAFRSKYPEIVKKKS